MELREKRVFNTLSPPHRVAKDSEIGCSWDRRRTMPFFSYKTKLRLARSIVTKSQPVYVQFYVTARCNLVCEQCNIIYANSDVSEIDLRGVGRIAENLERIG